MLTPERRPMQVSPIYANESGTRNADDAMSKMRKEASKRHVNAHVQQCRRLRTPPDANVCSMISRFQPLWVCVCGYNLDFSGMSNLTLDLDLVDDLRRSAPSLAFLVFVRLSTGISSSSDSSTVNNSGLGSLHE